MTRVYHNRMSLSRFIESLSLWRKGTIGGALLWFAVLYVAGGPRSMLEKSLNQGVIYCVLVLLLGAIALAVVLTELLGTALHSGSAWNDRRHFQVVGMLWELLIVLSVPVFFICIKRVEQVGIF